MYLYGSHRHSKLMKEFITASYMARGRVLECFSVLYNWRRPYWGWNILLIWKQCTTCVMLNNSPPCYTQSPHKPNLYLGECSQPYTINVHAQRGGCSWNKSCTQLLRISLPWYSCVRATYVRMCVGVEYVSTVCYIHQAPLTTDRFQ